MRLVGYILTPSGKQHHDSAEAISHRCDLCVILDGCMTVQIKRPSDLRAGLCANCLNARLVTSDKGSTFLFCELSRADPLFPKYPPLPVLSCSGFRPTAEPK